ncbi:MAG: hypothetical protein KF831_06795 [Acidobacteria bacterium]|nr:hypothetical protein [Acidobacteriota bacterium]
MLAKKYYKRPRSVNFLSLLVEIHRTFRPHWRQAKRTSSGSNGSGRPAK